MTNAWALTLAWGGPSEAEAAASWAIADVRLPAHAGQDRTSRARESAAPAPSSSRDGTATSPDAAGGVEPVPRSDPRARRAPKATRRQAAEAIAALDVAVRRDRARGVHVFRRGDDPEQVLTRKLARALVREAKQRFGVRLATGAIFNAGGQQKGRQPGPPAEPAVIVIRRAVSRGAAELAGGPEPVRVATRNLGAEIAREFRYAGRRSRGRG